VIKLVPWVPGDLTAQAVTVLVRRAERETIAVLAANLRRDSIASVLLSWPDVERTLRRWLSPRAVASVLGSAGERARAASSDHWALQVGRGLGRDVALDVSASREILQGWIAGNTARITSLSAETIRRVRDDLETAALSGVRPEELAAAWERDGLPTRNGTLRGRATVIARDQLGKLSAQIAEQQQRALGLTEYMWDDRPAIPRVQDRVHQGRRGARYKWDAPPPGGHPGHRPLCRCRAVAVVSEAKLRESLGIRVA
jgi:SPP1 gp7 family putative phage head morphogenesis protein